MNQGDGGVIAVEGCDADKDAVCSAAGEADVGSGKRSRAGRLESHGWKVSRLTLGTLQFGGERGQQDDQSSIRTVHAALDAAINVIDTGDSYGSGHSEEIVGRALGKRRPEVLIATKFDLQPDVHPSRGAIRRALTESLRRLRTDYIDLYQVHNIPAKAMQSTDVFDHLESFRDEGLVRAIGVTVGPGEGHGRECMMAARDPRVETVQAAYSLLSQSLASVAFPFCVSHEVAVFAREPLAQGLLTDALDDEAILRMGRRSRWPSEQLDHAVAMVRSFDRVRSAGESRAGFALRFALSNDNVASIVCGMRSVEEVAGNVRAIERGPLQPEVLQEIVDIYDSY